MNPTKEQLADPKWWSQNAPADATHYACAEHNCRPLWVKDGYYSCADEAFVRWSKDYAPFMHGELISRPIAWNGEGLPPAGTVCEVKGYPEGAFCEAEIIAYNNDQSKFWYCADGVNGIHETNKTKFRPLRTPEQIAAEEREMAIEEMWKVYWQPDAPTAKQALGLLYDAGYRKQEQTK